MNGLMCEICGKHKAKYVCQECGRKVCEFCLDRTWLCVDCYNTSKREAPTFEISGLPTQFKLFLLSFLMIFVGIVLLLVAAVFSNDFSGVVWFFPFPPLIIGDSSSAIWLFGFGVIAVVFCLILFFCCGEE